MSTDDVFKSPDANILSLSRRFDGLVFQKPAGIPYRDPATPTLTSEDQIYCLFGKEFKFGFELSPAPPATLNVVNKSSRAVWTEDHDLRPLKIDPNGKFDLGHHWDSGHGDGQYVVYGGLDIIVAVMYDPEPSLQQDLVNLLRDEKFTDVKLKCGDEEFLCHKSILAARSSALAEVFKVNKGDVKEFKISGTDFNLDPADLKRILHLCYSGSGSVTEEMKDNSFKALADCFNIKQTQEQVPELSPSYWEKNLQSMKFWKYFSLYFERQLQIEPTYAGKKVRLNWSIQNFEAWSSAQPADHIERLPEKRITFLDKEYVFEAQLRLEDQNPKAFLVSRSEGPAFCSRSRSPFVFKPNCSMEIVSELKGGDLLIFFYFTIWQLLEKEESQLQILSFIKIRKLATKKSSLYKKIRIRSSNRPLAVIL